MTSSRQGRPSEGECWKKINAARKLIEQEDWHVPNPGKIYKDLRELEERFNTEWATAEDKLVLFREALSEVRAEHYSETRGQPEISNELRCAGLEMWKFVWRSEKDCFGKSQMYIKFSVKGTGEQGPLYILGLHIDRPPSHAEQE
jgi:hypothetical protein